MILIPRYKELVVKALWDFVKETEDLVPYFLTFEEVFLPKRSFLWGILGTLKRNIWKQLLKETIISSRKKKKEYKEELIEIDPQILSKLVEAPSVSKG